MAITAKLELRQSQQLVMTPQLQQAIRLLQLSNLELNAFIETELERNPLLERDDEVAPAAPPEAPDMREIIASPDAGDGLESLDFTRSRDTATEHLDTDVDNVFPETSLNELGPDLAAGSWSAQGSSNGSASGEAPNIEAYVAVGTSLKDHLTSQLSLSLRDPKDSLIAAHLIDHVDEAGYIRADIGEMADKLNVPVSTIERVLAVLQTFDPVGVCARDLKECLALQLKERGRYDPMIAKFLDCLPLLAANNLSALRRAVGADMDDLTDMLAEIKELNPKPGLGFGSVDIQPVVPDVLVRMASDGSWLIELNADTLPRVLVNRVYYARVARTTRLAKDKDFLVDCLQNANWLVKSLDQRARTILRVAEEIVRQQDGFLTHGVQHLRPLNLKTIADAIKMHESTVSRVTSHKYIATPRGIFELKYFFTSSIASAGEGEAHSSEAVRHRIRTLIEAENAESVLSDDGLVDLLQRDGIEIARRTVAKYREAMRIPSSVQRRREKRIMA
jgi:RNA polymerase sigma-54 factor